MIEFAKKFTELVENEKYPAFVRDADCSILSCNQSARKVFNAPDSYPWKCHKALHDLDALPNDCYCGYGTEDIKATNVCLPSLKNSYQHIYIPINKGNGAAGSIDILKPISKFKTEEKLSLMKPWELENQLPIVLDDFDQWHGVQGASASLTKRETEVMELIMHGLSSNEISLATDISTNTVNYHMKNIFTKLGVKNRTQASAYMFNRQIASSNLTVKEMNHRVKNSFAILSSLVHMKMNDSPDAATKDALKWVGGQLRTFIGFHDLLVLPNNGNSVSVKDFLEQSMKHIEESYFSNSKHISLTCSIEDVSMQMNTAVPCLQIVSELVTNAIQHAFGTDAKGEIVVGLSESEPGIYRIIVQDNGDGMRSLAQYTEKQSMGMKIVKGLIAQINGQYKVESNSGTRHVVTFKK